MIVMEPVPINRLKRVMKKQTINDVARLSGVGKATVSRVFSGSPLVSETTREKVLETAREIGYRPNPVARALTTARTGNITIVLPSLQSFVMSQIVRGAMFAANKNGYSLFVLDSGEDSDKSGADYSNLLHEHASDGVIFCYESARQQMESVSLRRPVLFLESTPTKESLDCIRTDNRTGMRLLVEHLSELGHRRIAAVFGRRSAYSENRYIHFIAAMEGVGLPVTEDQLLFSNWAIEDGYRDFRSLMELPFSSRPSAIIFISDFMATGALRAAADMGIAVPNEVSIAGTDDAETSAFLIPKLTTLGFDPHGLGEKSVEQLIRRIQYPDEEALHLVVPVMLRKRGSTGPVRC